ncbi:hypothetical protein MIND_00121200 [Mycena indigotica]|uniref:Jacalin-type lectin domain-containing protein n=1 Tax=Mycena indigotica TaxID=2126181 RepID=A0A8H6TEJ8_9AGAR|nr:uncharacterized protein MIND_00121200 [Mycena indigotica]KAF7316035.1 hypothetical protein MIND_00121200 [Mycena indigotica]
MTTYTTALVSSNLFGDSKGSHFNDLEDVLGSVNITIDTSKPIKNIKIMHGGVIDGIEVKYYKSSSGGTQTVHHGTSSDCDDSSLHKSDIPIGDTESIIAISGKSGSSSWGIRVTQLSFAIYDSKTGNLRISGPYGNSGSGTAFRVTANGNFIALGGFAINTDSSLDQLKKAGQDGGLYGLVFDEVDYRAV